MRPLMKKATPIRDVIPGGITDAEWGFILQANHDCLNLWLKDTQAIIAALDVAVAASSLGQYSDAAETREKIIKLHNSIVDKMDAALQTIKADRAGP